MLDLRLIRENSSFVEEKLSTRGKAYDLSQIRDLTAASNEINTELCNLQSESKKLSKLIGNIIQKTDNKNSGELIDLKNKGNEYKLQISKYEEKKRILDQRIKSEILRLPNLPSDKSPLGDNETNNIVIREWGNPLKEGELKSH